MFEQIKNARKLQKIRSSYMKLKKKLCDDCLKGLTLNMVNNKEIKKFEFCEECQVKTNQALNQQSSLGNDTNKEIVNKYNSERKGGVE